MKKNSLVSRHDVYPCPSFLLSLARKSYAVIFLGARESQRRENFRLGEYKVKVDGTERHLHRQQIQDLSPPPRKSRNRKPKKFAYTSVDASQERGDGVDTVNAIEFGAGFPPPASNSRSRVGFTPSRSAPQARRAVPARRGESYSPHRPPP